MWDSGYKGVHLLGGPVRGNSLTLQPNLVQFYVTAGMSLEILNIFTCSDEIIAPVGEPHSPARHLDFLQLAEQLATLFHIQDTVGLTQDLVEFLVHPASLIPIHRIAVVIDGVYQIENHGTQGTVSPGGDAQGVVFVFFPVLAVEKTGTLRITEWDDFENNRHWRTYELVEEGSNALFGLENAELNQLRSGDKIKASGTVINNVLYMGNEAVQIEATAQPIVSGQQDTLVIVAEFKDKPPECSMQEINDLLWEKNATYSIDGLYRTISGGNLWFAGQVVGVYTLPYLSTDDYDLNGWADALNNEALRNKINPADYNRVIYVIPPNTIGYAGLASFGGNHTNAWIFSCRSPDLYAHELGHNLGMNHAAIPTFDYGDVSDFMGLGMQTWRGLNLPHLIQMGWMPGANIQTITENGIYEISATSKDYDTAGLQGLRIENVLEDPIFLSYRLREDYDFELSTYYSDSISVHTHAGGATRTYLLGNLHNPPNQYGNDTIYINGTTIRLLSHDNMSATVSISLEGEYHDADTNYDSCIDMMEIINYLTLWHEGQVDMMHVLKALQIWKTC